MKRTLLSQFPTFPILRFEAGCCVKVQLLALTVVIDRHAEIVSFKFDLFVSALSDVRL